MPKKFKRTRYEKDNDDHYIVVIDPWAKGLPKPHTQERVDWIGAWLRIALHRPSERNIVKNIYTMETRDEVVARISSRVDIAIGLGRHSWIDFMDSESIDKIKHNKRVDLSDRVSYIFTYNWANHGDPAERQWKEWFPFQDEIPETFMVKKQYPAPEWSEIPPVDARLRSLILPMPQMPDSDYLRTPSATPNELDENAANGPSEHAIATSTAAPGTSHSTTLFAPYQPPMHLQSHYAQLQADSSVDEPNNRPSRSGKVDKRDPYEGEDAVRANLGPFSFKQEPVDGVKSEMQDIKPSIRNEEYQPSNALAAAISHLLGSRDDEEPEDQKPMINLRGTSEKSRVIKAEAEDVKPDIRHLEYRPSTSLVATASQLHDDGVSHELEDRKPVIKNEDYVPSVALVDAISRYSTSTSRDKEIRSGKRWMQTHMAAARPSR